MIVSKTLYTLDQKKTHDIRVSGNLTCIAGTEIGVCGGTSEGVVFMIRWNNDDIVKWTPAELCPISAMATVPDTNLMISGTERGMIYVWDLEEDDFAVKLSIGNTPIHCIHADSLFVMASCRRALKLLSVVNERAMLSVHALNNAISWSHAWKKRIMKAASDVIEPAIVSCILKDTAVSSALALLEECTVDYEDRQIWCSPEFVDILLIAPMKDAQRIIKRLAAFRGPRFDCVICADDEAEDTVSYLKTCQHRFHTSCLTELVRKVPEYHEEMQYEYALSVDLACPICRTPFCREDIVEDTFLNKHLYIPYKKIKK